MDTALSLSDFRSCLYPSAQCDEDEDAYSCNECKKLFHMESLVVQAHDDGRPMEGFMCRPCHEASGKKEWWV